MNWRQTIGGCLDGMIIGLKGLMMPLLLVVVLVQAANAQTLEAIKLSGEHYVLNAQRFMRGLTVQDKADLPG